MNNFCEIDWGSLMDGLMITGLMESRARERKTWQHHVCHLVFEWLWTLWAVGVQSAVFSLFFLSSPHRKTRPHWHCLGLSVEMFCTDFCPMCLCLLRRYGKRIFTSLQIVLELFQQCPYYIFLLSLNTPKFHLCLHFACLIQNHEEWLHRFEKAVAECSVAQSISDSASGESEVSKVEAYCWTEFLLMWEFK